MGLAGLANIIDDYPSRNGGPAAVLQRKDPVVYNKNPEQCPIAYELIEYYQKNGFLVLDGLFDEKDILCFQNEMTRLRETPDIKDKNESIIEPGSGEVRSIFKVHDTSPVFNKLVADKRLVRLAEFILDDQVYIHQSRLNYKPGFRGKEFYWHSDFETWHVEDGMPRMRALSMSIVLTKNYSYNGPLMLIPGSQNDYIVCTGETPSNHFKESLKNQVYGVPSDDNLKKLVEQHGIFSTTGSAGSVIIFDCNTMHGSNSNITPFPRSNIFIVYNAFSNRISDPFCNQPRPEWVANRNSIKPLISTEYSIKDYA